MLNNLWNNPKLWRYLTNFWTIIFYIVIISDFVRDGAYHELLAPIAAIYIAILAIYAGEKEFERWQDIHEGRHPGEVFIIVWTVLVIGLIAAKLVINKSYPWPGEVTAVYITVLGVLAVTRKSRSYFEIKNK